MTRGLAACVGTTVLATSLAAAHRQAAPAVPANIVWVTATVTDHSGRLVPDLTKADFEVRDNGKLAQISVYQNDVLPFALVVMFDISGSMKDNFPIMRDAANQMIGKLHRGDRMLFGAFTKEARVDTRFAANSRKLKVSIAAALAGQSEMPCIFEEDKGGSARITSWTPQAARGGTAVWDGVACGVKAAFSDSEAPRRAVVLITDGADNASHFNQREARQIASGDGILVYSVWMKSEEGLTGTELRKLANETGGGFLEIRPKDAKNLGPVLDAVIEELHHQYVFGYVPPVEDGRPHKIEVTVRPGGMTVRARQNYLADVIR